MDIDFALSHAIPLVPLRHSIPIYFADGQQSVHGNITKETIPLQLIINGHHETIKFFLTKLKSPAILGYTWLATHNPHINWITSHIQFNSENCNANCINHTTGARTPHIAPTVPPAPDIPGISICQISATAIDNLLLDPANQACPGYITFDSDESLHFVSVAALTAHVYPFIEATADAKNPLPPHLADYQDVFSKTEASHLPQHREYDCTIDLKPDAQPPVGRVYNLTAAENEEMRKWINENLDKGLIRKSHSAFGAPCFFVKKADGSLRLCMDYRKLNADTIKNKYPLPLISDMVRSLSKAKMFTTLDLRGAYYLLRIKEGDEHKTAFLTKFGQFEFLVMPFGLANAPAQFQTMMNEIFRKLIGDFVLVYLDDIIIYSQDPTEHLEHVRQVLEILR
eukprot:Partr_v1_DN22906_c0_g1_i1_m42635 putative to reverse transcriptase